VRVLVAGASGAIGRVLVPHLLFVGQEVVGLRGGSTAPSGREGGAEVIYREQVINREHEQEQPHAWPPLQAATIRPRRSATRTFVRPARCEHDAHDHRRDRHPGPSENERSTAAASDEEGRRPRRPESLRANPDDRLPADPLGRVEGCNGIVEGRDAADVRPQSSVAHPLDDLT
jgi:hypothetical protein